MDKDYVYIKNNYDDRSTDIRKNIRILYELIL